MCNINFIVVTAYMTQLSMTTDFIDKIEEMKTDNENIELIIVNAGGEKLSHPNTTNLNVKRIDLPKNISFSNSMNAGMKEAMKKEINDLESDFIIVINNDAFPTQKGWLTKLYQYWKKTDAMIVCPDNTFPGLKGYKHRIMEDKSDYTTVSMFPAICYFLPKSTIQKIGYFDERFIPCYYEDDDYCQRVTEADGKIIVVKDVLLNHLSSKETGTSPNINIEKSTRDNYQRYIEKWGDKSTATKYFSTALSYVYYSTLSNYQYLINSDIPLNINQFEYVIKQILYGTK